MKKKTAFALAAALLPLLTSNLAFAQGDAAAGEGKITLCLACHGTDGNLNVLPEVPRIGGQNERYLLKQMLDIKGGARPVPLMTGMLDALSEQDLADIAAWYAGQEKPLAAAREDLVALGERLYRAGDARLGVAACTTCHLPHGEGLASAGYPALSGQKPGYTETQLRAFRSGERQNDETGIMRAITARLNDVEIEALASYVAGVR